MRPRTIPELLRALWGLAWLRLLVYLLLAALALLLARTLSGVIVTGVVAYALAYLVHPLLEWLERHRVRRVIGVLLLVLVALALLALLSWTLVAQVVNLLSDLPQLVQRLGELVQRLPAWLERIPGLENAQARLTDYLNGQTQQLSRNLVPLLQRLLASGGSVLGGLVSVGGTLGQVAFVVTLSLYFMLDYRRVGPSVLRLFPRTWQPHVASLSGDVSLSFGAYIRGQILIGLAVGAFVALGLLLLGIPNALAIGLLAAVLDIVPYLGPVLSAVPAVLLALPDGWLKVALVVLVFVVANQVEGNLLSPYILGKTTNLSSAAVLLAILTGLTLGGLVGALLAVPSATLLKRWTEHYWLPSRAHEQPPDGT